ncbi:protein of unknown function [Methylocella tundrae]|uniref:Uncharacterized protein n=1 Tax=Methylocella tundrae TaxID=227605 RepID=A0A4U8Z4B8_METTU|nr:protein of unknown function [Methylocella tundrae]
MAQFISGFGYFLNGRVWWFVAGRFWRRTPDMKTPTDFGADFTCTGPWGRPDKAVRSRKDCTFGELWTLSPLC